MGEAGGAGGKTGGAVGKTGVTGGETGGTVGETTVCGNDGSDSQNITKPGEMYYWYLFAKGPQCIKIIGLCTIP